MNTPGYTRTCSEAGVTYIIVLPNKMVRTFTVSSDGSRVIIDRCDGFEIQRGTDSFGTIGYEAICSAPQGYAIHNMHIASDTYTDLETDYGKARWDTGLKGSRYRTMIDDKVYMHIVDEESKTMTSKWYALDGSVKTYHSKVIEDEEEEYDEIDNSPDQYDY
jgi:hypothetical protein